MIIISDFIFPKVYEGEIAESATIALYFQI